MIECPCEPVTVPLCSPRPVTAELCTPKPVRRALCAPSLVAAAIDTVAAVTAPLCSLTPSLVCALGCPNELIDWLATDDGSPILTDADTAIEVT